jgi:hypothetical protein
MGRPNTCLGTHKTCCVCSVEKEVEEFAMRRRKISTGELREYRKPQCKKCMSEARKVWGKENPEKIKASNNGPKKRASDARRRGRLKTTAILVGDEWNDFVCEEAYATAQERTTLTGIPWEVDHILPISGKNVCGFHVWNNLRVITKSENRTKSNKYGSSE